VLLGWGLSTILSEVDLPSLWCDFVDHGRKELSVDWKRVRPKTLSNHFDAWEINSALALHGDSNSETGKCIYMLLHTVRHCGWVYQWGKVLGDVRRPPHRISSFLNTLNLL
jgi:hypothetical protein